MNDKLGIFISHKHEDEHAACGIRDLLAKFDDDENPSLRFFLSEEIPGGANWYEWIKARLVQSNLLLLLFTDATKSWDWCLYEAGLFDRLDNDHHRRVICLHSTSVRPPNPLNQLQAFAADPARLRVFLRQLLLETELTGFTAPIAPWVRKFPDQLDEVAARIAQLIERKPIQTRYLSRYVFIEVADPSALAPEKIPADAPVSSTGRALELFDLTEGTWGWGDLEQNARQSGDTRWVDELAAAIHASSRGNLPNPIQALFRPTKGQAVYRPVLYRADRCADGSMVFKVLFDEDCSWPLDRVPRDHAQVLTSLMMATRFKYELIEPYAGQLDGMSAEAGERACEEIRNIIGNGESQANSRGLMDQISLSNAFSGEDRARVRQMFGEWYEVRDQLMAALAELRLKDVDRALQQLSQMNRGYLDMATQRYREFVTSGPEIESACDEAAASTSSPSSARRCAA